VDFRAAGPTPLFDRSAIDREGNLLLATRSLEATSPRIDFGSGPVVVGEGLSAVVAYDRGGSVGWLQRFRAETLALRLEETGAWSMVRSERPSSASPARRALSHHDAAGATLSEHELPLLPNGSTYSFGPERDLYVVGELDGPLDFGGGRRAPLFDVAFLASYGPDGAYRHDRYWSDDATTRLFTAAVSGRRVALAGELTGDVDFGGGLRTGDMRRFLLLLED
jgi:hypothetical protein